MASMLRYNVNDFDPARFVLLPVHEETGGGQIYKRAHIRYRGDDGKLSQLLLLTPKLKSFGAKLFRKDNKSDGYPTDITVSLVSYDGSSGPTDEEQWYVDTMNAIGREIKKQALEQKDSKMTQKQRLNTDNMTVFFVKEDNGVPVPGYSPILNPKLLLRLNKKDPMTMPEILTVVTDADDNPVEGESLLGQKCVVAAVLAIESLYIGTSTAMQNKVRQLIVIENCTQQPVVSWREISGANKSSAESNAADSKSGDKRTHKSVFDADDDEEDEALKMSASKLVGCGSPKAIKSFGKLQRRE